MIWNVSFTWHGPVCNIYIPGMEQCPYLYLTRDVVRKFKLVMKQCLFFVFSIDWCPKKNFFTPMFAFSVTGFFTWQDAGIQTRVAATAARCVSCTHPFVRYYLPGIEQYWQLSLIVSCLRLIHFLKILNIKCNFFVGSYNSHSSNVLYIIWWGAGGNAGCVRVLLLVPGGGPAHPHQGRAAHPRHVVPSHHQV